MIKKTKAFLFDEIPSGLLGTDLQKLLECNACAHIKLYKEPIEARQPFNYRELSSSISQFNPDVIMLILSSQYQNNIKDLTKMLRIELLTLPIMAVFEGGNPDQMVELLKLGVSDFIIPPFKSIDILPRIWRILEHKKPFMQKLKERNIDRGSTASH
jgi:DNA-binding response OmpR family regulator